MMQKAQELRLPLLKSSHFQVFKGKGIEGVIEGNLYKIGSESFIQEQGIDFSRFRPLMQEWQSYATTLIYVVEGTILVGILGVSDTLKENAIKSLRALKEDGIGVLMATGDNKITAEAFTSQLGIDFIAEVNPEEKLEEIRHLQQKGYTVAMAGDGINDAPALAQANVGIAMGNGTDVAIENAAIILLKGDLLGIVKARKLSVATMKNVRQNLFLAFIYNLLALPLASGLLFSFGVSFTPITASVAMTLSSLSVVFNALRLRFINLMPKKKL
ncbi:hypothetical protein PHSC3_001530 [Chlamydiales bacterium STE3]|nr:hypothetical protein PHSC3_001530 [Chlamydiales bacterium STE3]